MSQLPDDFCVFILSHGRPDKIHTLRTLKRCNYTGPWYIIIDNEDKTAQEYIDRFGQEHIVVYNKAEEALKTDGGNNFNNKGTAVHARNASFEIARNLGYKYFVQLDDDYKEISYKIMFENVPTQKLVKNLDALFVTLLDFYKSIDAVSIAIAQGGDFFAFSGNSPNPYPFSKRKCMNSFICSVDRPFKFIGNLNDDTNTYTYLGNKGVLFFTVPTVGLWQKPTQQQAEGMSEAYKKYGTYVKSFITVMLQPSSVQIGLVGVIHPRLHHRIDWKKTVPMIVREKHRKASNKVQSD